MKRTICKTLGALLLAAFLVATFSGCEMLGLTGDDPIEVKGTWTLTGQYGTEKWIISETTIEYLSDYGSGFSTNYKADIAGYSNNEFNADDTSIAPSGSSTDPGYAVIKYTEVSNSGWGEVGKYQIFRWAQNEGDASKQDFTQGSKDANTDGDDDPMTNYENKVFDTAAAAESNVTNAAGFFDGGASEGAEKQ